MPSECNTTVLLDTQNILQSLRSRRRTYTKPIIQTQQASANNMYKKLRFAPRPPSRPRPPHSAETPITEQNRAEFELKLQRHKRRCSANLPVQINFTLGNIRFMDVHSEIAARSERALSTPIKRNLTSDAYRRYSIQKWSQIQANSIQMKRAKYPFLFELLPKPKQPASRARSGEKAQIKRMLTMMVENERGPAQLRPNKPQRHVPNVRWWRYTARSAAAGVDSQRTYYPNHEAVKSSIPSVQFAKRKWTPEGMSATQYDLATQIQKVNVLRSTERKLDLMHGVKRQGEATGRGFSFGTLSRFK